MTTSPNNPDNPQTLPGRAQRRRVTQVSHDAAPKRRKSEIGDRRKRTSRPASGPIPTHVQPGSGPGLDATRAATNVGAQPRGRSAWRSVTYRSCGFYCRLRPYRRLGDRYSPWRTSLWGMAAARGRAVFGAVPLLGLAGTAFRECTRRPRVVKTIPHRSPRMSHGPLRADQLVDPAALEPETGGPVRHLDIAPQKKGIERACAWRSAVSAAQPGRSADPRQRSPAGLTGPPPTTTQHWPQASRSSKVTSSRSRRRQPRFTESVSSARPDSDVEPAILLTQEVSDGRPQHHRRLNGGTQLMPP
jgi:hypothetical protein